MKEIHNWFNKEKNRMTTDALLLASISGVCLFGRNIVNPEAAQTLLYIWAITSIGGLGVLVTRFDNTVFLKNSDQSENTKKNETPLR